MEDNQIENERTTMEKVLSGMKDITITLICCATIILCVLACSAPDTDEVDRAFIKGYRTGFQNANSLHQKW